MQVAQADTDGTGPAVVVQLVKMLIGLHSEGMIVQTTTLCQWPS